ncbi:hypothetical protein GW17_00010575 [Ensete ventricosum]|nr:hypothetical protein GW17_00010575 [Ensete ventricosum]
MGISADTKNEGEVEEAKEEAMIGWGFYFGVGVRGLGVAEAVGRRNGESKSGKAPYRPVHTSPTADRYANRPLPGGTTKIDRRRSISTIDFDRRQLIDGEKGKRRRGKEERRRSTWPSSSPACCPRALAARGRLLSLCGEMKRLPALGERPRRRINLIISGGKHCVYRHGTSTVLLIGEDEITPGIATDEYISRRKRLLELLPENSLAIIASAPVKMMTDVVPYPYRQDADFLYITGCLQPGGIAVLSEECGLCMFMPDPDPHVSPKPSSHVSLIPIYGVSEPVMSKLNFIGVFAKIHSLVLPCKIFLGDICYI